VSGLRESLQGVMQGFESDINKRIDDLLRVKVLNVSIPLPFSKTVQNLVSTAFRAAASKEEELFGALGF
jgi:hypothetical protein